MYIYIIKKHWFHKNEYGLHEIQLYKSMCVCPNTKLVPLTKYQTLLYLMGRLCFKKMNIK